MEFRRLGDSGLKVSAVGVGCNNFGMRIDQAGTDAVVAAAKGAAEGKEGAGPLLTKAANCMGCHSAHK